MGFLSFERPTCREVTLKWKLDKIVDTITIQLQSVDKGFKHWMFHVSPEEVDAQGRGHFPVPLKLQVGQKFVVYLCGMKMLCLPGGVVAYECVQQMNTSFRTELTASELHELHKRALSFMKKRGGLRWSHCPIMTRNKPLDYYNNINDNHNGIMEVYIKDNNGDQASVINNQINGLFFGTSIDKETGLPPFWSHFGPQRLNVPPHLLINEAHNLYFADFYCNHEAHYVTLVLTQQGGEVDKFCKEKLQKLDPHTNAFLKRDRNGQVFVTQNIWVEVLYTENVNVNQMLEQGASFNLVASSGTSRPDGIPKNPKCNICNLYMD